MHVYVAITIYLVFTYARYSKPYKEQSFGSVSLLALASHDSYPVHKVRQDRSCAAVVTVYRPELIPRVHWGALSFIGWEESGSIGSMDEGVDMYSHTAGRAGVMIQPVCRPPVAARARAPLASQLPNFPPSIPTDPSRPLSTLTPRPFRVEPLATHWVRVFWVVG